MSCFNSSHHSDGSARGMQRLGAAVLFVIVLSGCGPKVIEAERAQQEAIAALGGTAEIQEGQVVKALLNNSTIQDGDLTKLKGLSKLEHLELGNTPLTDAALPHLKEFSALKYLDISGTGMSDRAVERFKKEHPQVTVSGPGI